MGLLDFEFDSPQNQGLLALGLNMMANSGPSTTPRSFGQIFGTSGMAGLNAMNAAKQQQKEDALRAMQMKQAQMGLDKGGMEMETMKAAMERQRELDKARKELGQMQMQQVQPQSMPQIPSSPNMGGSMMAGQGNVPDFMRPAPTQQPTQQQIAFAAANDNYQRHLKNAEFFQSRGFMEEAQKYYDLAEKFKPKLKEQVQRKDASGNIIMANVYDDGRTETVNGYLPAEKLHFADNGQNIYGLDPFTGKSISQLGKQQTLESIASNAVAMRGQNMTDARAREAHAHAVSQTGKPQFHDGQWVFPPTKDNPNGIAVAPANFSAGKSLTEDQGKATGWLVQAENAWKNMRSVAYDGNNKLTGAAKPGVPDAIAAVPGMSATANFLRSADRQKFMQASSSLSESLLRAATGAGINKEEAEQKVKELTPQFGDGTQVIQQKMDAIPLYIESLKVRAGPGAKKAAGIVPNVVNFSNVGNKPGGTVNFGDLK